MCDAHIALQELQAVVLCRMAFHFSSIIDALYLYNSAA